MAHKSTKKVVSEFNGVDIRFLGSKEESAEQRTVASRKKLRESLNEQLAKFIKKGGNINQLPITATSEKNEHLASQYGNRFA